MSFNRIGVIGGGAWGTALAQTARLAGREVAIWALEPDTINAINNTHENTAYLPEVRLDPEIQATDDMERIAASDAILMVAPAQFVRTVAQELAKHLKTGTPVVICAKGIEQSSGKLLTQVLTKTLPEARLAVLSGPSFAREVARGLPTAVTLACLDRALGEAMTAALGHTSLRPYWSDDPVGAEIGGAVKNVLAIAAGIVVGRELGANAHAALITRGFAELNRFGLAHGGKPETLRGLSGLGDLVLTCSSEQSRNMSLGCALGRGETLDEILNRRRSVSEGLYTAAAVMKIAQEKSIDMPICEAVRNVVSGDYSIDDAIKSLLSRPFRAEAG